ncbi:MAG: DUF1931 domain-containing protein [Candidatus Aenigmarchaeota archaeon]|nr:DUF1931 domain-containing protein [Candidatus Aenigmarchaeota archaeon]
MTDMLVVQSKIKGLAKKKEMSCGADAVQALSKEVACLVDKAAERAKANGRRTIKERDI